MTPERKKKIIKEVKSFALIIVVVFAFRSTFFEPFRIPSGSMIPTLMIGDFILVNKLAYGLKVPYSDMFWDPIYITKFKGPKRGDVIVFKYPNEPSINYIKRVIGLPGDELEIVDKEVFINDQKIEMKVIEEKESKIIMSDMDDAFKDYSFDFYKSLTGKHEHIVQLCNDNSAIANMEKQTIPEGKYFVMGDNRDFSADSRYWGFVPKENIKGKALFVWFSWIIPLLDDHPTRIRLHRIGTSIN